MSTKRHTVSISLNEIKHYHIPLVWVSIYCESKIDKQDLQAGER